MHCPAPWKFVPGLNKSQSVNGITAHKNSVLHDVYNMRAEVFRKACSNSIYWLWNWNSRKKGLPSNGLSLSCESSAFIIAIVWRNWAYCFHSIKCALPQSDVLHFELSKLNGEFLSPPVLMYGGLLCVAFRLSVHPFVRLWLENNSLDQKSLDTVEPWLKTTLVRRPPCY